MSGKIERYKFMQIVTNEDFENLILNLSIEDREALRDIEKRTPSYIKEIMTLREVQKYIENYVKKIPWAPEPKSFHGIL